MWPWDIYILFAYLFFCYYWSQCIIFNLYSASQSNQNHYISCLMDPLWLTKNASESFSFTRYVSGAVSDSAHLSFHPHARQIPAPGINDGICSFTLCHWYFVMSRWCLLISKLIVLYSELSLWITLSLIYFTSFTVKTWPEPTQGMHWSKGCHFESYLWHILLFHISKDFLLFLLKNII